ncbi:hypothetical protein RRG08_065867 [Elysia crispata]|uniref:VPS9 domain-containing protein n=1 Tax=Elysia crispata TaxID=231223 RepID=A0AAE1DUA2_9GAST|nr:hypothetical protein RRG08_065867 [Elysia crispata]
MTSEVDELEINPFYNALQTKYIDMYERAQECCYILCVPQSQSLNPNLISPGFVETHILRPSPYFKGQYMTTHSSNSKTLKLSDDNQYFTTLQGFSEEKNIKILSEELAYNKDYKQYKVLILERPFDPKFEKIPERHTSEKNQQIHTPKISVSECRGFLMQFIEFKQELLRLDDSIDYFCRHYMVLPDYLDDAVARLEDISSLALADIVKNLKFPLRDDSRFKEILAGTIESYMMDAVYFKVFPVIRQRFSQDDQLLLSKCHKLNKVKPQEIGVKEEFSCPLPVAVVELANLGSLQTPREKLACLKSTADNVTEGIEVSIQERNQSIFGDLESGDNDGTCITSDDLIPILVTIISRAKCCHLPSDLFYIENFMWNSTDKDRDDLGFCLVSFKAAVQYMLETDFSNLNENDSTSKEISLDELAAVTERRESFRRVASAPDGNVQGRRGAGDRTSTSASAITPSQSRLERQLSRISGVLSQTVEEMDMAGKRGADSSRGQLKSIFSDRLQVQPPDIIPEQERKNEGKALGGFLAALQEDDFDQPFGKQT